MPKLTPAQLDEAAERWNRHVERLLEKRKADIRRHTEMFVKQAAENEEQRQRRRFERYLRVQAAREFKARRTK